jgi:hypothetical protein
MQLHHGGMLREPLVLPLGAIAVAAAEQGPARALPERGRFPILRRIAGTKVVPREEGVEGWLWTTSGGSAFLSLCEDDEAPNAALVFTHPLGEDLLTRTFEPECVATVAARSPLGSPAVYGLLMRVNDVLHAQKHVPQVQHREPADGQGSAADAAARAADRRLGRSDRALQQRRARRRSRRPARARVATATVRG